MAQRSFSIDVNPRVLKWARNAAGQTTSYVAELLGVSEQTVHKWETGKSLPDWNRLRKLAHAYQRPLAALLLPKPPSESEVPPDFRTLPTNRRKLTAQTLLAIRTARWLQSRAIEMRRELGMDSVLAANPLQATQNPERDAAVVRNGLGINLMEQTQWQSSHQAYRRWRESLEDEGVLVFQFPFPVKEVRGFSLFDPLAPTIVVNESDTVNARIFTLFHEYTHLLLQKPGICLPQEVITSGQTGVETYCNRFAAELLIPREEAIGWSIVLDGPPRAIDYQLQSLANRYRVSRDVVLVRLRTIGIISESVYAQTASRWGSRAQSRPRRSPQLHRGGPSAAQICQRQRGSAFVSLVFEAADRGTITDHDVVTYLGVKLKHLNKLRPKR
jgi:Zn-dependent peptidase ImmA (M78 family)/DNA-binding XRE family transcriptional regulator